MSLKELDFSNELLSDQEDSVVRDLLSTALKELDLTGQKLSPYFNAPLNLKASHETAIAQVEKYRIAIAPHNLQEAASRNIDRNFHLMYA